MAIAGRSILLIFFCPIRCELNVVDVNRDKMIDRLVYSDKVRVNATERPIKTQLYDT